MRHEIAGGPLCVDGATGCFARSDDELHSLASSAFDFDGLKPGFWEYQTTSATFCINLSDACNLRCDYCFNPSKSGRGVPLDEAILFLDRCFASFLGKEKYVVDLSGKGEPLLFLKEILEIKRHCDEWSNRLRREVLVQFVTNGTLLDESVASVLQKNGILFGVSLDGTGDIHDRHRKDASGCPTYQAVLGNVNAIAHHEYVGAACTLTRDVFSLNDSLNELSKTFSTVSYKPARNCDEAFDESCLPGWFDSYDELVKELMKEARNGDLRRVKVLLNGEDYLGKFIRRVVLNQRVLLRCDAGLSRFALDEGGMIYACPASFGKEGFLVGEKFQIDPRKSEAMFLGQISPSECSLCDFRHICGGECPLEKALSGGVNKAMCRYKSHLILLAMSFSLGLCESDEAAFLRIRAFCEEVERRKRVDPELMDFLDANPSLSFVEGKRAFNSMEKRY